MSATRRRPIQRDTCTLTEGEASLSYPAGLSKVSVEFLQEWVRFVVGKIGRQIAGPPEEPERLARGGRQPKNQNRPRVKPRRKEETRDRQQPQEAEENPGRNEG